GLMLLQNSDDLLFREAAALHVLVLSMAQNELQTGLDYRGKVKYSAAHVGLARLQQNVQSDLQKLRHGKWRQ
ncbi:hypothetical protein, partial [Mesorhizobium captivum]|uniref:hypothetical protein n=1 Tax=Mesorhizobium captivum TaxID=3072319 RepID=UPI002A249CCE